MHAPLTQPRRANIVYPESDGKPMADNTLQFRWIVTLQGNIAGLLREQEIFVAGDLLWYPVEGFPEIVAAPDVLVAFGRPKGERRSYKQWEEDDIAPQVVFEVLSHTNTIKEMDKKFDFYEEYGVEEYYYYDPDTNHLRVYVRTADSLLPVRPPHNHVSPRLKIRFDLSGKEMVVFGPDGQPFRTFDEIISERNREHQLRLDAEQQRDLAAQQRDLATQQRDLATQQRDLATRRADRLAELTSKVLSQQATPAESQELQELLKSPGS
ncbi:MAG: Uma2 family endonuclease [Thermomicrobiales bacterium]